MKKTRKILLYAITLILLFNTAACSSSVKANQDINPADVLKAVLNKLAVNPEDVGEQYYSEGDADHVLDDVLLRMIYPPSFSVEGDIVYSLDLFDKYAVVQYEKYKPVIFEMGIFRVQKQPDENETLYRGKLAKIETMCKERTAKIKNEIFAYNPDKAYIADNSPVYIYDNYVYYIIAEDYSAAYDTVKSELAVK